MDLKKTLRELQRRHVVKAGLAYLAISWVVVEVATAVLPLFEVSEVFLKGLVVLLAIGFPIWIIIAWVYDFTPEGLKKTEDVPFNPEVSAKKNLQLNRAIIGGLSIAVILLLVNQVRMSSTTEPQPAMASMMPDFKSSIAVLAFDDMSPDKDQEYLSDGISEEILNYLAKYKDLKVISRTSSFAYKGKDVTIDVIGEELGVAYVLEGSVRKAGDTYRITVQLIDTKDGAHIWSDTFDRRIEDVLFVQDEIAKIVAERLKLTFSNEDVRLRKVDPEAYELYLQALDVLRVYNDSTVVIGDSLLRRSIAIDPTYSPPWAIISATTFHKGIYHDILEKEEAITIGMDAAKKAVELDSTNVIALNWLSNWQWHNRQGSASFETLQKVMDKNPNQNPVFAYAKHAYIRMGMPEQALKYAYRALQLNPNDRESYKYLWFLEDYMGNYDKATAMFKTYMELLEKQTELEPDIDNLAWYYYRLGEVDKALETIRSEPDYFYSPYTEIKILYSEGHTKEADRLFEEFKSLTEQELLAIGGSMEDHYFLLAALSALKGDKDSAFNYLDKSYEVLLVYTEGLWNMAEFRNLQNHPRWDALLGRLGKEFNYDFNQES